MCNHYVHLASFRRCERWAQPRWRSSLCGAIVTGWEVWIWEVRESTILNSKRRYVYGMLYFFRNIFRYPKTLAVIRAYNNKNNKNTGISAQITGGGRYTRHTLGYLLAINGTRSTPGTYRQLLAQTLKKAKDVHCTSWPQPQWWWPGDGISTHFLKPKSGDLQII